MIRNLDGDVLRQATKKENAVLKKQNAELRVVIARLLPYAKQYLRDKNGQDSIARTDIDCAYAALENIA